jgi:hypothetical protein
MARRTPNRRKGIPQSLVLQTPSFTVDCQPTTGDHWVLTLNIPVYGDPVSLVVQGVDGVAGPFSAAAILLTPTTMQFDNANPIVAVWVSPGTGMRTASNGELLSTPIYVGA